MSVFVTGATSGLGRNAVEWLLQTGHQVLAFGRDRSVGQQLEALGAQFIGIDLVDTSVDQFRTLMAGCDVVWHCAAKSSPWGQYNDFYQNNTEVTARLADAAGQLGIPRFVHISTPAIYFDYQHHLNIDESYRAARFANHYAQTKFLAEERLQALTSRYPQTTYVILRPRGLFGPHDRVILPRVLEQIEVGGGVLRLPRGGEALLDLTFVGNVVEAMALASERAGLVSGAAYNITNHEPARLVDMLEQLLAGQLGMHYRVSAVPYPLLHAVAGGMELFSWFSRKEPLLTRYSAGAVNFDMTLSAEKARQELGYQPRFSLNQGIELTGNWLNAHLAQQRNGGHGYYFNV
ncbi:NAD(P)-dependent oxidoreductase [Pectobacterium sp. A535-S3-A17]|uniref:NAD-dependent epimerase/dehydratase family protein n=1 Tax=Pectobacterium quasiaquaticum TaxID=2774015 RepID=UPI0018767796|nr:NAD(P)-dependent oxidoreductase [Pectobacterium quasiaquaticum]MBE5212930.1 NAD(P)-dependent oxidoreductase [Pectobacterium quasiaquaticum]MBE5227010.1 NAD(P)-dependent oxidoreductase [Pectobacterium quasiaquaticum]